jgi:hypothetical protein
MNSKGENKIIYQDNEITKFLIVSKKYGNFEIIIDSEDWDRIKQYRWFLNYQPKTNKYYITTNMYKNKKRYRIKLHRFILNLTDVKIEVDHIFGETFDNRKNMLRECTHSNNSKNQKKHKDNNSGYKGVSFHKQHKKWLSRIIVDYKIFHLGYFTNKHCAACAYNNAALKYHGEYANLNQLVMK